MQKTETKGGLREGGNRKDGAAEKQRKAEGQGDFEEGFQALVRAVHTACLLMPPSWTMLGKLLPDPSHLILQRQSGSINPCFISSHSVWIVTMK